MSSRGRLTAVAVHCCVGGGLAVHLSAGVGAAIRQHAAVEADSEIPVLVATNATTRARQLARADAGAGVLTGDGAMPTPAVVASIPADAVANYAFDGEFACIQGPFRHLVAVLSMLKSSVVGGLHASNTVSLGSCEDRGYPYLFESPFDGSTEDHCYPPAQLWWGEQWIDDPELGHVPFGGLMGAQTAEVDVVEALHRRATAWPAQMWEDATKCDCVEGSEVDLLTPHLDTQTCWEESLPFVSSFVTDDGLECVEAPLIYVEHALAAARSSALAALYADTRIEGMTCASRGFEEGVSETDACYQRATSFHRSEADRDARRAAEDEALAAYVGEHGTALAGHSPDAVRRCGCTAGSELFEGLSATDRATCDDPALRSPVLEFWRPGYQ